MLMQKWKGLLGQGTQTAVATPDVSRLGNVPEAAYEAVPTTNQLGSINAIARMARLWPTATHSTLEWVQVW